jgi:hypothetical protein
VTCSSVFRNSRSSKSGEVVAIGFDHLQCLQPVEQLPIQRLL